jgi:hypothetical protein
MRRLLIAGALLGAILGGPERIPAHDRITTAITWNREISRIVFERCASCHRSEGTAFSLMTYEEARPWAVAIKEEVLSRRMPPWGAVKGFGEFRNDQGLTQEQLELITDWVEGGVPEGDPKDLPEKPKISKAETVRAHRDQIVLKGDSTLTRSFRLAGILPQEMPPGASMRIVAELPDGSIEPLLWLYEYREKHRHAFLFRKALTLPRGTMIRGVAPGASIILLPA